MYHTPQRETRSAKARRLQAEHEAHEQRNLQSEVKQPSVQASGSKVDYQMVKILPAVLLNATKNVAGSIKSEPIPPRPHGRELKSTTSCVGAPLSSKGSQKSSASKEAMRKQLLLEAAKQKAAIKMDLIDKTLDAQLAALNDEEDLEEYSSQIDGNEPPRSGVAEWVEHQSNHREPPQEQQARDNGVLPGELHIPVPASTPVPLATEVTAPGASGPAPRAAGPAPTAPHAPNGTITALNHTVQLLAGALKDLSTANHQAPNVSLLSRISTPKDLPEFSGDQLEWLQFKQAYEESTEVCKFSDKENLWRLRKCLRGAAKDAVSALFISATSPDRVMSTLELRFGNPDGIISRILQDIKKLQPLQQDYHKDIVTFAVKVQNFVEAVRAVGREEYLHGMSIVSSILSKLPTVLISKWSDYSFKLLKDAQKSRLVILSDFLNDEALKISTTANFLTTTRNEQYRNKHSDHLSSRQHTVLVQAEESVMKCSFCRTTVHNLTDCKQFKRALRKVRWQHVKKNGLCYKCIISKHERDTCKAPACDKDGCGAPHHRLLHYSVNNSGSGAHDVMPPAPAPSSSATVPNSISTTNEQMPRERVLKPVSETLTHINASDSKVLLKVVPIRIHGPKGVFPSTCLLDDGSTVSLLSAALARRAGLRGHAGTLRVRGAFTDNELVCESTVMNVNLTGIDDKVHNIRMRCVNELNLPLQSLSILNCSNNSSYLMDIKDKLCTSDTKPELLIGQDNFHLLLPLQIKLGKSNEPVATLTPLGWCVSGKVYVPRSLRPPVDAESNLFISETEEGTSTSESENLLRQIHEEVRRSFVVDTMGVTCTPRQNAEHVRAVALLERSAELREGRWHVGLPWRDPCTMPDARPSALTRMKGIERKMSKDPGFAERYRERVNHLLENDYARELTDVTVTPKTWYLPHFGVDNPNKKNLRLVFDAASKVNNHCLNDYLLTGPDLLSSLLGIMLRFREHRIAVTGDIKDMFLRVKIRDEDQHALRFLWRTTPTEDMKTYAMTSLVFGTNCSPFIAQFIKNKNAQRYESSCPAAVDAICNSHYMDDYIQSLPDEPTAIEMVRNISDIHMAGGFLIRNWTSNSVAVLNSVPKETLGTAAVRFKVGHEHESERTLGLIWYPADDMLGFDTSLKRIPDDIIKGKERPTKRLMLRVIMSIFDVLGFLSPFTIQGRILLQSTWSLKVSWDDYVPDDIYCRWRKWIDLLMIIKEIRIPRCYKSTDRSHDKDRLQAPARPREMQDQAVIGDSDTATLPSLSHSQALAPSGASTPASTRFYETVADTTCATDESGYRNLNLILFCDASTRAMCTVAYWRWEDNGVIKVAFIASKCKVMPVKQLTVPRAELQAALLAARLANTIGKEHKLIPARRYFWCDSTTVLHWIRNNTRSYKTFEANRLGQIDELTRVDEWRYIPTKLNVADLATRDTFDRTQLGEWFAGPNFLYENESVWPKDVIHSQLDWSMPECVAVMQEISIGAAVPDPLRFSSWLRLLRAAATVLKFIDKCKGLSGPVDCGAMERAERLLLHHAQSESFGEDLVTLKNGKPLHRNSRLVALTPYIDEQGLLRVGGRIDAAVDVAVDVKRPVILDGRHPVAKLIVRHYHVQAAHGNQEAVVNELKQRYWMFRLRPTVKSVASRCMLCRIRKSKPQIPRMGDLPKARVAHHQRPFSYCGLDLFGPMEVVVGRRREKRYGALFTCLTVRAVHIELVSSLTSDSLIMALRRMAARRGWPRHLFSDNGTNLRGADAELQRSIQELDTEKLKGEGVNRGMEWTFIPPASPHWGGAWERLIRSVKTSLKVILNERAPRDEVLSTLMAEVENIVNSRPLMHVSVDTGDVESLTPNHFLLGTSSNLPAIGAFDNSDLYLRKHWRTAQRLTDMYWQRWVKEILPDLVPRRKWHEECKPLQVGDLVLVVDPNSPRNMWPKGLVTQVFPGKDGRTRLVEVRTGTGTWRRSAARVAPISLVDEC